MSGFNPNKLHIRYEEGIGQKYQRLPRCYTLTHSDRTGDLFLTVAESYDLAQISGWYTKFMRDEVLGEWGAGDVPNLHLHCHVSGGLVLGPAKWRADIFRQHLPLVLDAICYGDRAFLHANPDLHTAAIKVHFHARQAALDCIEDWGLIADHLPGAD